MHLRAGSLRDQQRALDPPETVVTDVCESPCGHKELNSGPLEHQLVILTTRPPL